MIILEKKFACGGRLPVIKAHPCFTPIHLLLPLESHPHTHRSNRYTLVIDAT